MVKDKKVFDHVLSIIEKHDMRVTKIKELKEEGVTKTLYYETLNFFGINPRDLTGGPGTKPTKIVTDILKRNPTIESHARNPTYNSAGPNFKISDLMYKPTYEYKRPPTLYDRINERS